MKIESALARLAVEIETGRPRDAAIARLDNFLVEDSFIPVSIRTVDTPAVLDWLSTTRGHVANIGTDVIEAYVTPESLRPLDSLSEVLRVSQVVAPHETATSQGTVVHEADHWHARGVSGAGVRVGIIDSFVGFSALMGSELPGTVTARCYSAVGVYSSLLAACESRSSHGTAVAESLVDAAPSVELFIANPRSYLDFRQTVDWLTSQGVQVINFSATWLWDGPGDGSSPFSDSPLRTVDAAVAAGSSFVTSAGNHQRATYFGAFSDGDGDGWTEFNGVEHNTVLLQAGETVVIQLRWQDTWMHASRDLDVWLLDPWNNIVGGSADWQDGRAGAIPMEYLAYTAAAPGTYRIGVFRYSGSAPGWVQLQNVSAQTLGQYSGAGSIGNPAESANPGLVAVGAAAWNTPGAIEYFSSRGPTPDGRTKPDLVGCDRADTVTYGVGGFAGTSQAAPHVAGLAALARQAFPAFSPVQVSWYLRSSAAGRGSVPNNDWGYGFAMLPTHTHPGWADDFDGDGAGDVVLFRPSTGTWYLSSSRTDSPPLGVQWGLANDVPVPADYDGDRRKDLAVYRPSSGTWFIVNSGSAAVTAVQWGTVGDKPVPADYDGDGRTDLAVYRPSTGDWYVVLTTTRRAVRMAWGLPGDVPVPSDYDGDGRADVTVFRPATGTWHQFRSTTNTSFEFAWGQGGDIPLAGDYDGDGRADPTVFRPSTGAWYELRSTTGAFGFVWGRAGDIPLVGDYDGDGKADPTVFRPPDGTWYQLRSTTGATGVVWGAPGDVPL